MKTNLLDSRFDCEKRMLVRIQPNSLMEAGFLLDIAILKFRREMHRMIEKDIDVICKYLKL